VNGWAVAAEVTRRMFSIFLTIHLLTSAATSPKLPAVGTKELSGESEE
jgi:hypothetical protein